MINWLKNLYQRFGLYLNYCFLVLRSNRLLRKIINFFPNLYEALGEIWKNFKIDLKHNYWQTLWLFGRTWERQIKVFYIIISPLLFLLGIIKFIWNFPIWIKKVWVNPKHEYRLIVRKFKQLLLVRFSIWVYRLLIILIKKFLRAFKWIIKVGGSIINVLKIVNEESELLESIKTFTFLGYLKYRLYLLMYWLIKKKRNIWYLIKCTPYYCRRAVYRFFKSSHIKFRLMIFGRVHLLKLRFVEFFYLQRRPRLEHFKRITINFIGVWPVWYIILWWFDYVAGHAVEYLYRKEWSDEWVKIFTEGYEFWLFFAFIVLFYQIYFSLSVRIHYLTFFNSPWKTMMTLLIFIWIWIPDAYMEGVLAASETEIFVLLWYAYLTPAFVFSDWVAEEHIQFDIDYETYLDREWAQLRDKDEFPDMPRWYWKRLRRWNERRSMYKDWYHITTIYRWNPTTSVEHVIYFHSHMIWEIDEAVFNMSKQFSKGSFITRTQAENLQAANVRFLWKFGYMYARWVTYPRIGDTSIYKWKYGWKRGFHRF